jgi:cytoskeletal protein CcmA (bactofilin family)
MKHILFAALLLVLPLQMVVANTVVRSGDTVTLASNQSIDGSFYVVGGTVALSGKVVGDTTVIGGNVTVGGEVTEDLAILAGTVSLQAPMAEDVRIVAGQVTITESIKGNLVVVAGKLTISSKATIGGDVLFYGGELVVEGEIGGKLLGSAESIRVDSAVKSGIDVSARTLTLGEQAVITGDVEYTSDSDVVRAPGASVDGEVVKNAPIVAEDTAVASRQIAVVFLVSLFATLSFYLIFRRMVESFALAVRSGLIVKTVLGFVFVFMAPILVVILLVSVLGSLVGLVALCLFILLLVLAVPLLAITAGSLIASWIDTKSRITVPYILLGAVIVHLSMLVPVFGVAVVLWLFLATVGTLVDQLYRLAR